MKSLHSLKTAFIILIILFSFAGFSQNNITITDEASHNADESAVLDIYSTSKGMLIPRMTTSQINAVSNPATGLLIFNTDLNSFYFYNDTKGWQNLSDPTGSIWGVNQSTGDVYLTDYQANIGIGTDEPFSKFAVVANSGANPDEALFEVQDEFGKPIFSVTSEGVRIYVKGNTGKGVSGGFAVGRYGAAKGMPDTTYLMVTPDSTRVYTQEDGKGVSGGFAVGRYGAAKVETNTIFYTNKDSTRIYTKSPAKGVSGGFAVGRYGTAKGTDNFLHLTEDNYLIGHKAGASLTNGIYNIFLGYEAGMQTTGDIPNQGSNNVFVGFNAGRENIRGHENLFLGYQSGINNTTGSQNVFIGTDAGFTNTGGFQNIFIGQSSGYSNIGGVNNLFIGENAGFSNTSGQSNVSLGNSAGYSNNNNQNVFIGQQSGLLNVSGTQNVMVGLQSGMNNDTGSGNVFLGVSSGRESEGSDNVFLGKNAGYYEAGSNKFYIENSVANSSDAFIYGEFDNNYLQFNVNTGGVEGRVNINNVLRLQPRSSAPPDPEEGDLYVGTDFHIYCCLNSTWVQLD